METALPDGWLALVVGNSRLHWGAFGGDRWLGGWHTPHLTPQQGQALMTKKFAVWDGIGEISPASQIPAPVAQQLTAGLPQGDFPELWVASVVASQRDLWQGYPALHTVTTAQVPLTGAYSTLGVDRALSLVGAGAIYGWPVLVVDGGTALTLTAGAQQALVGGAILPGVRSQFRALHDYTDGLPWLQPEHLQPPHLWAKTTPEAILSGVLHTQLAGLQEFITHWRGQFPNGAVVFTGGDGAALATALTAKYPQHQGYLQIDPNLMFWGLRVCRHQNTYSP
jgi:type III pantothenate kinase